MSNFHSFEVVDRGSETQLQVGENENYLMGRKWGTTYRMMTLICQIYNKEINQTTSVNQIFRMW